MIRITGLKMKLIIINNFTDIHRFDLIYLNCKIPVLHYITIQVHIYKYIVSTCVRFV